MKFIFRVLGIFLIFLSPINGAKILGLFYFGSTSHYFLGSSLMRGLSEKGHDVTFVTTVHDKTPPKNGTYREIVLDRLLDHLDQDHTPNFFFSMKNSFIMEVVITESLGRKVTELALDHPKFKELLQSNEKFDVVLTEQFSTEAVKMVALHFNAPLVLLSTVRPSMWSNLWVANPAPPSYIPELLSTLPPKMDFCQRLQNTFYYTFNYLYHHLWSLPRHRALAEKHFPNAPSLDEILFNTSLTLLNSHPIINQPVPSVPNMVEIGGFHIKTPKALPKDLQDFLDNAQEGVVYFSMGSNLKSAYLPIEKRDAILNSFGKLKQKVIWKWEEDSLPNAPPNLKLLKWAPQQDILAHPNVKLFMTHGGLLSAMETIYNGVPILAVPVFGDQVVNALNAEYNGYGLALPFNDLTEQNLGEKLNELLDNPKYAENAKMRSSIYHDQESKPLDRAVFWIEYVVRHKGAPHLQVEGVNLPFYKYLLLDVIAFVILVIIVILVILRTLCRALFCKKTPPKGKIKKN